MKKDFIFLTVAMFIMMLSGCTSLTKSQFSSPFHGDVRASVKADIEIGEKISGYASATTVLKIFKFGMPTEFAEGVNYVNVRGFGDSYSSLKEAAVYDAVSRSNADIILAPSYTIEVKDYFLFATVNVTVMGYKGTIKGLKNE